MLAWHERGLWAALALLQAPPAAPPTRALVVLVQGPGLGGTIRALLSPELLLLSSAAAAAVAAVVAVQVQVEVSALD